MATTTVHDCCLRGFQWNGTPTGHESKLGPLDVYIAGNNPKVAILLIHDLFTWKFPNLRLLADHYATEVGATVFMPDFFGGDVDHLPDILASRWDKFDRVGFLARNGREHREPEIFESVRDIRRLGFECVAVSGFCYGGWSGLRLGAKEHDPPLVDCVTIGHPSLMTKEDFDGVGVPVQVLAPEIDQAYTDELKLYTFQTFQKNGIPFEYHHFPGVEHACLTRGDENVPGERDAMIRGKNVAVRWMKGYLHGTKN